MVDRLQKVLIKILSPLQGRFIRGKDIQWQYIGGTQNLKLFFKKTNEHGFIVIKLALQQIQAIGAIKTATVDYGPPLIFSVTIKKTASEKVVAEEHNGGYLFVTV